MPGAAQGGQHLQAGHDGRAGRRGRQQRPYLRLVARPVQHDQHAPVREQPPVQGHPFTGVGGHRAGVDAQGPQQLAEHVRRFAEGVAALELDVQLAVGEGGADGVGDADRHGGLADARGPVQVEGLRDGALRALPGDVAQPPDQVRLDAGPGELREARREGVRTSPAGRGFGGAARAGVGRGRAGPAPGPGWTGWARRVSAGARRGVPRRAPPRAPPPAAAGPPGTRRGPRPGGPPGTGPS